MQDHIVKSFDRDISRLNQKIISMGRACEEQIAAAADSFRTLDSAFAAKIVKADKAINRLQQEIEQDSVKLLALRQPMAADLRHLLAVMKIASELERIGDYAANVAKRVTQLTCTPSKEPADLIVEMAGICRTMIQDAINAFLKVKVDQAIDVWKRDDLIDRKFARMMALVRSEMEEDTDSVKDGTLLIFIGRCCERIGDHITNIAEDVYYMATGEVYMDQMDEAP